MPYNSGSVSSSLFPFFGEYTQGIHAGTPMYDNNDFSGSLFVQQWSAWYQPTTGTGQYISGSFKIRDTNNDTLNGKMAGEVFKNIDVASDIRNGFMDALDQTAGTAPTDGSITTLAAIDYTAISESNRRNIIFPNKGIVDGKSADNSLWGTGTKNFKGFRSKGHNDGTTTQNLQYFNLYRRNITNAYGTGGANAKPHFYFWFMKKGAVNGQLVCYGSTEANFTSIVRNVDIPAYKNELDKITSGYSSTGSIAALTYCGIPVLQPREIYGQNAMFLPNYGNLQIQFAAGN